VDLKLVEID